MKTHLTILKDNTYFWPKRFKLEKKVRTTFLKINIPPRFALTLEAAQGVLIDSLDNIPDTIKNLTLVNFKKLPVLADNFNSLTLNKCAVFGDILNDLSITDLSIHNAYDMESLDLAKIKKVEVLALSDNPNLNSITSLPDKIKILEIKNCKSLKLLPALSGSLKNISLEWLDNLESIPELPEGLEELKIKGCKSLSSLPQKIPSTLKKMNLRDLSNLESIPELPEGLEELNIQNCKNVTSLPQKIPSTLKKMNLRGLSNLESIPKLPEGLEELNIQNCKNVSSLPQKLPSTLKKMNLEGSENLKSVPNNLPEELKSLDLIGCISIEKIPENLPSGLKELVLNGCENLEYASANFPQHLEVLDLSGTKIKSLPEILPSSLKTLLLKNCKDLKYLPIELPKTIRRLNIEGCKKITELPSGLFRNITHVSLKNLSSLIYLPRDLPDNMESLNLTGCSSLVFSIADIQKLVTLANNGCRVTLADGKHYDKKALEGVLLSSSLDRKTYPDTSKLLHKAYMLSEESDIADAKLLKSIAAVVEYCKSDDANKNLVEEVSYPYTTGCVNRPLAGLSILLEYINVMKATTVDEKIDAYKKVAALRYIEAFVQLSSCEEIVKAELMNNILKKCRYSNLFEYTSSSIPNVYLVNSYLTKSLLNEVNESLDKIFNASKEKIVNEKLQAEDGLKVLTMFLPEIISQYNQHKDALVLLMQEIPVDHWDDYEEEVDGKKTPEECEQEFKNICKELLKEIFPEQKDGEIDECKTPEELLYLVSSKADKLQNNYEKQAKNARDVILYNNAETSHPSKTIVGKIKDKDMNPEEDPPSTELKPEGVESLLNLAPNFAPVAGVH